MFYVKILISFLTIKRRIFLDAKTILMDEENEKLLWEPIRGGNISFKIESAPESAFIGKENVQIE